jgi:aspartyl-tRNA(Asn)/glutamyl-tRNA(Gln) amidotransferase subunit A
MTPAEALDRIHRYDAKLKAFVRVFDEPLGQGSGPVFAVKDMIDVAHAPTHGGGQAPITEDPPAHAVVVEKLLSAGWSAIGKTHTVELAYGAWGTNRAVGAPWNPWDPKVHRAPGGSSSGSGVAVASGMADAALGTDTGGSVRIPACLNGIVGLKPGRGLVSLTGVHPLSPALDTVGTLAPTVEAAARMLAAISGPDGAAAVRPAFDAEKALSTDVKGWRLAAVPLDHMGEVEHEVAKLYLEAIDRFRDAGVTIEFARPPRGLDQSFTPNGRLMAGEGWRIWKDRIAQHRAVMDPWIVRRFEVGQDITDADLAAAHAERETDSAEFHSWLLPFDGLLGPTCPLTAPPMAKIDEATSPMSRLTRTANYLDLPAISVPCGLSSEGLPVGFQIFGRPQEEGAVVALGAAFEKLSGWNGRRPDLSGFEV